MKMSSSWPGLSKSARSDAAAGFCSSSDNRYAWIVTDLALMALGAVSVPRGSETPSQELEFILNHARCTFMVVETDALLARHQEMLSAHKEVKTLFIIEGS